MGRYYLDTGPLLDFLVLRMAAAPRGEPIEVVELSHVQNGLLSKHMRESRQLRQALAGFLAHQGPFFTVAGVVAEIHRRVRGTERCADESAATPLPRKKHGLDVKRFWKVARDEFAALKLGEDLVPLNDMELERLALFGPTDASLMVKAAAAADCTILTSDEPLFRYCRGNAIPVRWIQEILS